MAVTGVGVHNYAHHQIRHLASRRATVLPIEVVGSVVAEAEAAVVVVDALVEVEWGWPRPVFEHTVELANLLCFHKHVHY